MSRRAQVAVSWFERPGLARRWCRARRKTTTDYVDRVETLCGHFVILPIGLSDSAAVDCEECLARERPA